MSRPPFMTSPWAHTRTPRTGSLTYRDLHGGQVTTHRPSPWSRIADVALRAATLVLAIYGLVALLVRIFP